ncbi:DUF1127 domain-containing protein [Rhodobacteraceae bacterium 63075]|nr:DUF1127 domain-containing protein [Rhodobacteraceae bacterium 63075]
MAAIELTSPRHPAKIGRIGQVFAATRATVRAWNDARNARKALMQLSDRELDDIGLCRGDIDRVVDRHR